MNQQAIVNKPHTILDGVRVEILHRAGCNVRVKLAADINATYRTGDRFWVKPSQLIPIYA